VLSIGTGGYGTCRTTRRLPARTPR
jgi:hypothetical protein